MFNELIDDTQLALKKTLLPLLTLISIVKLLGHPEFQEAPWNPIEFFIGLGLALILFLIQEIKKKRMIKFENNFKYNFLTL